MALSRPGFHSLLTFLQFWVANKTRKIRAGCSGNVCSNCCLNTCRVLEKIEHQLDDHQPEEQHGFRRGNRSEEHFLTVNAFLDTALDVATPVWVLNLHLSKAFDRVHWPALWKSLLEQGISQHMVWMISKLYDEQFWRAHRIDRSKLKNSTLQATCDKAACDKDVV